MEISSTRSRRRRSLLLLLLLSWVTGGLVDAEEPAPLNGSFLTFDQLPPANRVEERLASYEQALEQMAKGKQSRPEGQFDFIDVAVDLSAVHDPEDVIVTAHALAPTPESRRLYEELGVALLTAARQARLGDEHTRAHHQLQTARIAFDLADQETQERSTDGRDPRDLLHRAMVGLEETLVGASQTPSQETAFLLRQAIAAAPEHPSAAWARRMLASPATYLAETDFDFSAAHHASGNLRAPVKIFAPPPRCTGQNRQACIKGLVIIRAVIDRHGSIAGVKLLKGLPAGLSEEALRTVSTWLFEPAILNGRPTPVLYTMALRAHWE